MVFRRKIMFR